MFFKNLEGLRNSTPEPLTHNVIDENGKPIFRGDGSGIDYSKVKPAE